MHSSIRAKGEASRARKARKQAEQDALDKSKLKSGKGTPGIRTKRISYASSQSNQAMKAIIEFNRCDTDGDGLMGKDEFKSAACNMLDQGGLSHLKAEMQSYFEREFEISDADHSKALSEREFGAWYIRFHDWVEERTLLKQQNIEHTATTAELKMAKSKELMAVVKHCDRLQTLVVQEGDVDNSTVQSLAQLRHSGLKSIDFTKTQGFDDRGIKGLAVYCTSELSTLKLGGTSITDNGFLPVAKFCKGLRDVEVTRTKVTGDSLKELHADCVVSYVELDTGLAPAPAEHIQRQLSVQSELLEPVKSRREKETKQKQGAMSCVIL